MIRQFFQTFVRSESFSGILLIGTALLAFGMANSSLSDLYNTLKQYPLGFELGSWQLEKTLNSWIKDLLMAFFFLLVGLEIKREVQVGELSDPRRSRLAIVAALGGMVAPALFYLIANPSGAAQKGWGIPMATDIAFALGVLTLLGQRVPLGLKVFLTALAIVDDLGAVLVVALFYSSNLNFVSLAVALALWAVALWMGRQGQPRLGLYLLVGAGMWYATLLSGVSPTVAAVLLALAIPLRSSNPADVEGPLHRLEHAILPWSSYLILPIFAFFNAGVTLRGLEVSSVTLGAFWGLLLGKPLGIVLACVLAVRLGYGALPQGVTWPMMVGVGLLGGIGFTMSLFVAALAFPGSALLDQAKAGVLSASVLAGLVGLVWLHLVLRNRNPATPATGE